MLPGELAVVWYCYMVCFMRYQEYSPGKAIEEGKGGSYEDQGGAVSPEEV